LLPATDIRSVKGRQLSEKVFFSRQEISLAGKQDCSMVINALSCKFGRKGASIILNKHVQHTGKVAELTVKVAKEKTLTQIN
jgi:hypothetical protein